MPSSSLLGQQDPFPEATKTERTGVHTGAEAGSCGRAYNHDLRLILPRGMCTSLRNDFSGVSPRAQRPVCQDACTCETACQWEGALAPEGAEVLMAGV